MDSEKPTPKTKEEWMEAYLKAPFICGRSEDKRSDGMPVRILVCPAHGSDWTAAYFHGAEVKSLQSELQALKVRNEDLEKENYTLGLLEADVDWLEEQAITHREKIEDLECEVLSLKGDLESARDWFEGKL